MEELKIASVDCKGCGLCCMHVGHPMFIRECGRSQGELAWLILPADLKQKHLKYIMGLHGADDEGSPCYWLDLETKTCKHYGHRPRVCQEFEPGSPECKWFIENREMILDQLERWVRS